MPKKKLPEKKRPASRAIARKTTKPTTKASRIKPSARAKKSVTTEAAKTTKQNSVIPVLSINKNRAFFIVVLIVVIVAGIVMLVPKQTTTSATTAALQHVVTYQGQDGKNALDLLKAHHQVAAQEFSIGSFVTAIDGISAPTNYFWAFSVNGKPSDVGPDQYITKNGDTLKWQLERIQ